MYHKAVDARRMKTMTDMCHDSQPHESANHNKGVLKASGGHIWQCHASRVHSQIYAKLEARDSDTDIDLSPRGSETLGNLDEVYYSFDADASPVSSLGLDSLVDHAEALHKAKETDKLVKDEYEVLDGEGEAVKHSKKRGKKAAKPALNNYDNFDDFEDIDGDWETV